MEVLVQRSPKFSSYLRSRRAELRLSMSTCAAEVAGPARCVRWWRSATRPWRLGAGAGRLWGEALPWRSVARPGRRWGRRRGWSSPGAEGRRRELPGLEGWSRSRGVGDQGVLAREELAWNRGRAGARLDQGSSRRGGAGAPGIRRACAGRRRSGARAGASPPVRRGGAGALTGDRNR